MEGSAPSLQAMHVGSLGVHLMERLLWAHGRRWPRRGSDVALTQGSYGPPPLDRLGGESAEACGGGFDRNHSSEISFRVVEKISHQMAKGLVEAPTSRSPRIFFRVWRR
mmetsp:Transcript_14319/g.39542  ORF Transcript_14319/g.39542 Transcript_14319/m.39542 type:complete len:109 (-) Transcript_14319:145-471(-)